MSSIAPRLLTSRADRLDWFAEAKFGLFLHYGLYSLLGRGEWAQRHERIPQREYEKLANEFTAERFDADEITDLALAAEMKYVNLTTRHHDSFCLFDSSQTDFNSAQAPNCRRDLVGEMAEQCQRKGLGLFLYYSYSLDWRHPYFPQPPPSPIDRPRHKFRSEGQIAPYIDFVHAQLTELLTNYGQVAGIWFDPLMMYFRQMEMFPIEETYALVRELQPQCLISFKQGANGNEDYATPERDGQSLADKLEGPAREAAEAAWQSNRSKPMEMCDTMLPSSWGHSTVESDRHRSAAELRQVLAYAAHRNSNLLLNTGPLADGSIDPMQADVLTELGDELRSSGFPAPSPNYPAANAEATESIKALRARREEASTRGPLLQFVHLPKTGGSSLNVLIRELYKGAYIRHDPPVADAATRPRLERFAVVSSHLSRTAVAELFPTRALLPIAIVREPISRLVSLYNDATNREIHPWYERVSLMSPAEFFDALLPGPNQRTDIFGPGDFEQLANQQRLLIHGHSARADDAHDVIDSEFFAIGTTEQHGAFVRTLVEHLGWPAATRAAVRNVSEHTLVVEDLSTGLRDRLQEFNEQDALLYEYVSGLSSMVVNSYESLLDRSRIA